MHSAPHPPGQSALGAELLRLCSVVRWPARSAGSFTSSSSSCLLFSNSLYQLLGLVHGVAQRPPFLPLA
jgi:hypothetical protein